MNLLDVCPVCLEDVDNDYCVECDLCGNCCECNVR